MNSKSKIIKKNTPRLEPRMESNRRKRLLDAIFGTLHTYAMLVLAVLCALWMAEDVFSEITLPVQMLGQVLAMLLPLAIFVGIAGEYWRRLRLLWRYAVPMLYFGRLVYYGFHHTEELQNGMYYLSRPVLEAVNFYYKTNFVSHAGGMLYADSTLAFIVLCAAAFFLTEALWCYKRILLAGLPVIVLAGEMAVGQTPQMRSMVLLFLLVLLSGVGSWEGTAHPVEQKVRPVGVLRRFLSLLVPVGLLAVCLLIGGIVLQKPAVQIAEYGVTVRQFQWDMEEQIEDWVNSLTAEAAREDWDDVTNLSPNYSDAEVLHATFSDLPTENQYLRGYYGTYYENGKWSSEDEAFDILWDTKFPGKDIASFASYQRGMYDDTFITVSLEYVGLHSTTVYIPFTLDRSSLSKGMLLTGEYRVTSPETIDTVKYEFRDVDSTIWYDDLVTSNAFASGSTASWYTSYVEDTYLDVPDSLAEAAAAAVDDINEYIVGLLAADDAWLFSSTMGEEGYYAQILTLLTDSDYEWDNGTKYYAALLAAEYMSDWTYSTNLSRVPNGSDVVAYFMTESHTGYCVHYATAAVMILRSMGVPARYATGYLCRVNNATLNEDGEYEVSIRDSDAHAWVEIYLDGIGWYPVEVTPGAGQMSEEEVNRTVASESERNADVESESNAGDIDSENDHTEDESSENESNSGQAQTESEATERGRSDGNNPAGNGVSDSSSGDGTFRFTEIIKAVAIVVGIILLIAAVVIVLVFLCVILPRRREQMRLERIRRDIRAGKNRRAIYGIHRMINRKLRRKTHAVSRKTTDREYADLLEKHFPQEEPFAWEKYVEIVQKCVFSKEDITAEEVQYCERMLDVIC